MTVPDDRAERDRDDAAVFWDQQYRDRTPTADLQPHSALIDLVSGRPPGQGMELGCGHGDNAIWCALQGWEITAVDISQTALERLLGRAQEAGVAQRIHAERHDLMRTLPSGPYDLVFALFMHSPSHTGFDRQQVLRRAAGSVARDGLLLDVAHGSRLPWSWPDPARTSFPSPAEAFHALQLEMTAWEPRRLDRVYRKVTGPDGQTAVAIDTVVCIHRR